MRIWPHSISRASVHASRLDGQYGTGAVLADVANFSFVTRGKDYAVLNRPEIQTRLHLPADQSFSRRDKRIRASTL